jgi:hypothetical protein
MGKSGGAAPSISLSNIFIHCNLKTRDRHEMTLSKRLIFAEKLDRAASSLEHRAFMTS